MRGGSISISAPAASASRRISAGPRRGRRPSGCGGHGGCALVIVRPTRPGRRARPSWPGGPRQGRPRRDGPVSTAARSEKFLWRANDVSTFIGSYVRVTDAPLSPALLALLQIIEDLCAAIAQGTGLGLFARLLLIPVRRQLRGMAEAVSEAIAESATRAPDASPIFIPMDPRDAPPDTPPRYAPEATGPTTVADPVPAAPVQPPRLEAETLPQDPRAQLPAAVPAAPSGEDDPAAPRPAPDEAAAPVMAEAGRRAARTRAAPARNQAASASPPPVAPAVAALRSVVLAAHRPAAVQKAASEGRVLRVLFVTISKYFITNPPQPPRSLHPIPPPTGWPDVTLQRPRPPVRRSYPAAPCSPCRDPV